MNLLKKQGFYNSIILYAGTALGFFNLIILFQRVLTIEEIGFFSLLIAISVLYAQIASLGINSIILRYFPYYRSEDRKHGGFVNFVCLFTLFSFLIFTLLFILFKTPVINHYKGKTGSSLLIHYYYYLIPVSFFTVVYTVLESLARTVFKNVLSAFLKEVLLRVFTSISILLILFKWINYHHFIVIYVIANALIAFILWISIYRGKHFRLNPITVEIKKNSREMISYGFFAVLSGGSFVMIQNLDLIMLSAMTEKSLALVGVYTTFFGIATVISLPAKALNRTSYQIIADAFKDNDLAKIGKIYYKTSVIQALLGCLLLVGLIINKNHILYLLHKPEYQLYFNVFIVVGLAFLVDITGGLNGGIISSSKYYRLVTLFLALAVVLCFVLNLILIPTLGMISAAYSYLIVNFLLNFTYWLFIKVKFGLQPFNRSHAWIIVISIICLAIGWYLPTFSNYYIDAIYRSVIVTIIYSLMAYFLKVSDDINILFDNIILRKRPEIHE